MDTRQSYGRVAEGAAAGAFPDHMFTKLCTYFDSALQAVWKEKGVAGFVHLLAPRADYAASAVGSDDC